MIPYGQHEVTKEDIVFFEDMFQPGMESLPYILPQVSEDYRPTIYLICLAIYSFMIILKSLQGKYHILKTII